MAGMTAKLSSPVGRLASGAIAMVLAGCASLPEVMYGDVFSPPDTYLDVLELDKDFVADPGILSAAVAEGRSLGMDLVFVGAVQRQECGVCYVMRPRYADHTYVVFLVERNRVVSWMSFSQLENGR